MSNKTQSQETQTWRESEQSRDELLAACQKMAALAETPLNPESQIMADLCREIDESLHAYKAAMRKLGHEGQS